MIKKSVEDALNHQINRELYSAYLYASMSAYFETQNLKGFALWMQFQAREESMHAQKFYTYLIDRGGRAIMRAIEAPPSEWKSPLNVFEEAYKHEQHVTQLINNLADLAIAEKDHATNSMLQWFINEQVEEEAHADEMVQNLKMVGSNSQGLFLLDREAGQRTPPAPPGAGAAAE